ncbi:MAG: hypothetical protein ABW069_06420, partial [Duganella sp.]
LYLAINLYAQSSTTNLNSGGTPGVARYALWYLPLWLPLLLWLAARVPWRRPPGMALGALCLLLTGVAIVCYDPRQPESYLRPSALSLALQTRLPGWYDPPPQVFSQRYGAGDTGSVQGVGLVVGPDCRKALLLDTVSMTRAAAPGKCLYDLARLNAYRRALGRQATRYVELGEALTASLRLQAAPGSYRTDAAGSGGFALGQGWSGREPWGVWSDGPQAALHFPCRARAWELRLALQPFSRQALTVTAGGKVLWQGALPADGPALRLAIAPAYCNDHVVTVVLHIARPTRPSALGPSHDRRQLGVALSGFTIGE